MQFAEDFVQLATVLVQHLSVEVTGRCPSRAHYVVPSCLAERVCVPPCERTLHVEPMSLRYRGKRQCQHCLKVMNDIVVLPEALV